MKRERISTPPVPVPVSETSDTKVDIVNLAGVLIEDAGNDMNKRISAINTICEKLYHYDAAARDLFIGEIASQTGLKKTLFNNRIKEIEKIKRIEEKKRLEEEATAITEIDRWETFLAENYSIKYNEVSNDFEIKDLITGEENVNEYDILRNMKKHNIRISVKDIINILKSNYVMHYNPIQDYFKSLKKYDPHSEPNYIERLCRYFNVTKPDKFYNHLRKHLIRTVACAFEVDLNKQVFTLVGDGKDNQNSGKSYFIRWLVPPALKEYYLEDLPHDKDALIALSDNFIINFDELESLTRYEINRLKSFISKDSVKVRIPYDNRARRIPRRASFYASTNEINFLSDLTGNVRWVVFRLKPVAQPINWAYAKDINVNDIWRQAYYLFSKGEEYRLTREEIEDNERENLAYMILPPEYDIIVQFYRPGTETKHDAFYTTTDFVKFLSEKSPSIKFNAIRVGKVLRKLGYQQVTKRIDDNNPIKGYYIKFNMEYKEPPRGNEPPPPVNLF